MFGILVDVTRCTGCEQCAQACVRAHDLSLELSDTDRAVTRDGLTANRWCTVLPMGEGRFARKSCMHCLEPACVSACLVGALKKTPEGPVIYDSDKCIGCRYCLLACPFHIPRYQWATTTPFVQKCTMCFDRLEKDQVPACVEACPHDALLFGERAALIRHGHRRIDQEKGRYIHHIWGEKEFGGTSVLYLSDVDLSSLGWTDQNPRSIPAITEPLISKTPQIGLAVFVSLFGLHWIIERRTRLMSSGENGRLSSSHPETRGRELSKAAKPQPRSCKVRESKR